MSQDYPVASGKRRSVQNGKEDGHKKRKVAPSEAAQFSDLPDNIHKNILSFLSSGIHNWSMSDTSLNMYKSALASWRAFSLISRSFKKNAHCWALKHFGVNESEYLLFKQIQKIRALSLAIMEAALKAGEISHLNRAVIEANNRPLHMIWYSKRGLLLKMSPASWGLSLYTPFGVVDLLSDMRSDRDNMSEILFQRLPQRVMKKLTLTFDSIEEDFFERERKNTQYYLTQFDTWYTGGSLYQKSDRVSLTKQLQKSYKGKSVIIYPDIGVNKALFMVRAIADEAIEPMERHKYSERRARTNEATCIIWNIFSARYAKEPRLKQEEVA